MLEAGARNQADVGNRTRDLILTMDALYQLSYVGAALRIVALTTAPRREMPARGCASTVGSDMRPVLATIIA